MERERRAAARAEADIVFEIVKQDLIDALGGVLHVTTRAHLSELAANLEQDHAWRGARSGLAESSAGGSGSGTSMTGYDWRMERRHAGHLLAGNGLQLPRSSF